MAVKRPPVYPKRCTTGAIWSLDDRAQDLDRSDRPEGPLESVAHRATRTLCDVEAGCSGDPECRYLNTSPLCQVINDKAPGA